MDDLEKLEPVSKDNDAVLFEDAETKTECIELEVPVCLSPSAVNNFPDGGLKAWTTVVGAFLALFCTFGQMYNFGTFQLWYSEHQLQGMPPSTISWIGSIQLGVFFGVGGPVGRAFDFYGPQPLIAIGTAMLVFSIMMTSISTQYYQYVICQGILFGLGVGMTFFPSVAAVSTHFSKYRASALGLVTAGSCLGGVIYPIVLQRLLSRVGFAWSVRILGFITLFCCCISIFTVKSRLPPTRRSGPWMDTKAFRDTRFALLTAGSFLISLGIFIPPIYISSYAKSHSISANTTFYVLSAMNAGGVFGRIMPAMLSDAVGRFNLLYPSALLAGLSCLFIWIFAHNLAVIIVFSTIFGFLSGAFISLINPCVAQISDIREIGMRIGMLYSVLSLPALVGGPIAGAILFKSGGSYTGMIALAGSSLVAGSILLFASRLKVNPHVLAKA